MKKDQRSNLSNPPTKIYLFAKMQYMNGFACVSLCHNSMLYHECVVQDPRPKSFKKALSKLLF